jgi:hypothetical protein
MNNFILRAPHPLSRLLANQPCVTGGEGNFSSESYRDKRLYLKL